MSKTLVKLILYKPQSQFSNG